MIITLLAIVAIALLLAFANGSNDNAKGVATLIGSRTLALRPALWLAAGATMAGSIAAIFLAGSLVARFTGKGIVDDQVVASAAFALSVGLAAGLTVLAATFLAVPISTTHAMVGAIIGIGTSAGALHLSTAIKVFFIPLLASPLIAVTLAGAAYLLFRGGRRALGINHQTCVCIEQEYHPVTVGADGAVALATTGLKLTHDQTQECRERYHGQVAGLEAQSVLDWSHLLTAAAVSFARGLNDTPKIAAVLIAAGAVTGGYFTGATASGLSLAAVGIAIAAGGLLAVRRVAQTMSYKITEMNDGQAFTANLTTAFLVIVASRYGVPVSTTHVSCGSLFGIGAVSGKGHWSVIGKILAAWVITLPVAGAIGFVAWRILSAMIG